MKNCIMPFVFCIFFFSLMRQEILACTAFQLSHNGHIFVGKNYDWLDGNALIVVNKRGVSKTATRTIIDDNYGLGQPVSWISKYGNITFNPFGREFPFGGMNEAGLIVEALALPKSEAPTPDSRPSISSFQWLQYLLDNFSTVTEVIACDSQLRIRPTKAIGHVLVNDKEGNCAVIEFLNGKQVYKANKTMPYKVLTNSTYTKSLKSLKRNKIPWRDKGKSIERFINTVEMVKNYSPEREQSLLDYSFDILKNVSWREKRKLGPMKFTMETQWSIVYDVNNLRIYFQTLHNHQIRLISLRSCDFSCATPVRVLDINARLSGDMTNHFIDYTYDINRDLIRNSFKKTPSFFFTGIDFKLILYLIRNGFKRLPEIQDEELDTMSRYPDTTICEIE